MCATKSEAKGKREHHSGTDHTSFGGYQANVGVDSRFEFSGR
jgi:hypothetical protein